MKRCISLTLALLFALSACDGEGEPKPLPPGEPPDPAALNVMNELRTRMGLPTVVEEKHLTTAARAHVDYYLASAGVDDNCAGDALSPHYEIAGCPGFTGEAPWDRTAAAGYPSQAVGECIHFVNDPEQSVYDWLISVYHRFCIAAPEVSQIGYARGNNTTTGAKVDVLDVGHAASADPSLVARWPVPGDMNVPKAWDGMENPQPPPPPDGYPSGPIVGVIYGPTDTVEVSSATLTHATGVVPATVLTPENDPNLAGSNGFFIYSDAPLVELRTYTVRFRGTRNGASLNDAWDFYVPCDRSYPDQGKICDGNALVSCNINTPVSTDCGSSTCLEYTSGARCIDYPVVNCGEPDGTFLRCDGARLIYCIGGYELVEKDCGDDLCVDGRMGPTCAAQPQQTCESEEQEKLRCEGDLLVLCELGYIQHAACDPGLFCQVNSTGQRGFCSTAQPPCSQARCAGDVPVDCVDNYEVAEPICPTGTCVADGNDASCT
jgi:hypothetical protein